MKSKKIKLIILGSIVILLLGFIIYCHFENTTIETTELCITSNKIPDEFDGYTIAHISDLHNTEFGENNSVLLNKIELSKPDVIFITGDIIDAGKTDIAIAIDFLEKAIQIAPIYYVTGNHEASANEYADLAAEMKRLGVTTLDNQCIELEIKGAAINLMGLADPAFANDPEICDQHLEKMSINKSNYTILLSHRPELFDLYVHNKIDLVFSGHAHGGQFRLPFIGGFIAPGQGIFPDYTSGIYEKDDTKMVVSRGLGNSIIPIRIGNNPEFVIVTLKKP